MLWGATLGAGAEAYRRFPDQQQAIAVAISSALGIVASFESRTKIARRHGTAVLSDCVQALGKVPIDVHAWGIDYATFSAHKFHGPKGVGALYVKQGSPIGPLHFGGHQENGLRACAGKSVVQLPLK